MRGIASNSAIGESSSYRLTSDSARSAARIDIGTFEYLAPTDLCPAVKPVRPPRYIKDWSRLLGTVGSLLVHAIALDSVGWGISAHKPRPQGIGSVRVDTRAPPSEELVLLDLDSTQKGDSDPGRVVTSLIPPSINVPIDAVSPEPLAIADDSDTGGTSNSADVGDPTLRALMAGRYRGQISARIERAWIRPRTPVGESMNRAVPHQATGEHPFVCQVQIRQDAAGNVQEVLLLRCNGTEAWRHSLVVAINQSSPLPAPPIPAVFARALTMTFEAHAYEAGAPPYEYETQGGNGTVASGALPAPSSAGQAY